MGRPKKRRLPKEIGEVEQLTSDEVMQAIFGKRVQKALKKQALTNDPDPTEDDEPPTQST